jgi:uncharacterized protein
MKRPAWLSDDIAYMLPMGIFLVFTWIGSHGDDAYVWSYPIKTILTAIALIYCRPHFTPISWRWWWLGAVLGVIGIFQWVGMEHFLLQHWPNYPRMSHDAFNPHDYFHTAWGFWSFTAIRWAGASLVVPFMEEYFWRDFLWRTIIAPNDFKLASVGEWDWKAFLLVALIFGAGVHIEWMTAIVWGLMIGLLLAWTKSLGACIVCHGVTNFLLGAYVLHTGQWGFW